MLIIKLFTVFLRFIVRREKILNFLRIYLTNCKSGHMIYWNPILRLAFLTKQMLSIDFHEFKTSWDVQCDQWSIVVTRYFFFFQYVNMYFCLFWFLRKFLAHCRKSTGVDQENCFIIKTLSCFNYLDFNFMTNMRAAIVFFK